MTPVVLACMKQNGADSLLKSIAALESSIELSKGQNAVHQFKIASGKVAQGNLVKAHAEATTLVNGTVKADDIAPFTTKLANIKKASDECKTGFDSASTNMTA